MNKLDKKEAYTQASNAGAIKVDILGQSTKKKNKKDKEDPIIKSLPAQQVLIESEQLKDINWLLNDYDIDITTKEELGSDYYYRKLVTNVDEAEKFNYHSDYWGDADSYQEDMVNLMYQIEPYINKNVIIDIDGESYKYKLLGVLIDKQYNSINHAELLIEEINDTITENKEVKTEGLYDDTYKTNDREELKELALNAIYVANNDNLIIKELKSRLSSDEKKEWKVELNNFITKPYDYIANNYYNIPLELLREIALDAIYVANDDEAIQKEINDRKIESKKLKIESKYSSIKDAKQKLGDKWPIYQNNDEGKYLPIPTREEYELYWIDKKDRHIYANTSYEGFLNSLVDSGELTDEDLYDVLLNESKKLKIENKDEFKDLELKIAKEINTYLINKYDIDLTDGTDLGPDKDNSYYIEYIEECLEDFISASLLDYEDQNNLELTWDYKLDINAPHGIKVNVWEV